MKIFTKREDKLTPPDYKTLEVSELKLAPYQRGVYPAKIKKYAQNFDYDVFGVPLVSLRDGEYWIVDGQNRVEALKLKGIKTVLCQVLHGLTYEEEALKFVKLNTDRTVLSSNQKFHARVESGEQTAKRIAFIIHKNNLLYARNTSKRNDNQIGAISCVERIMGCMGEKHLDRVLRVIKKSWCGDADSLSKDILTGMSTFFEENKRVNETILISALERTTPQAIRLSATVFAATNSMVVKTGSGSKEPHIAKIVRDVYVAEWNRIKGR